MKCLEVVISCGYHLVLLEENVLQLAYNTPWLH